MEWNVKNALSRNTEREHLNKILADIKKTIESKTATPAAPVVQSTVPVVAKPRDLTITLTGPVTGQGKGVTGISIATSLSEEVVMDAPKDGNFYWRFSGKWLPVPSAVLALNYIEGSGLLAWNFDDGEFSVRNIEGTPDQIDVDNGDGYSANPVISLAPLWDAGGGSFKLIDRDSFGRIAGSSDGTTDDVPEGSTNLYYTNARADARVAAGIASHEAAADPHPQYTTAAEAAAAAPVQSVNGQTGAVVLAFPPPVPLYVSGVLVIPANTQVLWTLPIEFGPGAELVLDGEFVEVV